MKNDWRDTYANDEEQLGEYTGGRIDGEFGKVLWSLFVFIAFIALVVWWTCGGDREGMAWDRVESIRGATDIELIHHSHCYSVVTEGYTDDMFEFYYMRKGTSHAVIYCCSALSCEVRR